MPLVRKESPEEVIVRISPSRNTIIVQERSPGGVLSYREIDPVEFYYALNGSCVGNEYIISHIECGRTTVSLPLLISIAQALSVDLYALLDGIVESRPKTSFGIEFENVLKDATPDQLTLCLSVCRTIMEHGKGSLTI